MSSRIVLIIADPDDAGARAAANTAAASLPVSARILTVSASELASARWHHTVSARGGTSTRIEVRGIPIVDADLAAVWFRSLAPLVPFRLRGASAADREYAASELTALVVSWLSALGDRVVNAPEGGSPTGPGWPAARWRQLAAECGIETAAPTVESTDAPARAVLVAGHRALGADPRRAGSYLALARRSGCRALELRLSASGALTEVATVPSIHTMPALEATASFLTELAA